MKEALGGYLFFDADDLDAAPARATFGGAGRVTWQRNHRDPDGRRGVP
jgi:hypothetical protein